MFIEENELKNSFWDNYKNRSSIKGYQFESNIRNGCADLLTIELFQDKVQINTFEFKLTDIKKALAQAEANLKFSHRCFVVLPANKEKVIRDKYDFFLKSKKYIGVIVVEDGGRWNMIYKASSQPDSNVTISQEVLKILIK
ncbi:MAG: hypothetical protein WBO70_00845 [Erysipelotrichaceae bacterium]